MRIDLKKFGTTLISRETGKEALAAFEPTLREVKEDEMLEVDFSGVNTFSPSWADEFLFALHKRYGERLTLQSSKNPSVNTTITFLESIHSISFSKRNEPDDDASL